MRYAIVLSFLAFGSGSALAKPAKPAAKPAAAAPAAAPAVVAAPAAETASAEIKNAKGEKVGDAVLEETPHGVLVTVELSNLPPGAHAFHIHEHGKCDPAAGPKGPFTSAGGHLNPEGKKHGIKSHEGKHEGDLPNVSVGPDGKGKAQFLAEAATLKKDAKNSLLDADGTSLVLHAKEDDHMSDPAGAAGDRIACGVITAAAPKK